MVAKIKKNPSHTRGKALQKKAYEIFLIFGFFQQSVREVYVYKLLINKIIKLWGENFRIFDEIEFCICFNASNKFYQKIQIICPFIFKMVAADLAARVVLSGFMDSDDEKPRRGKTAVGLREERKRATSTTRNLKLKIDLGSWLLLYLQIKSPFFISISSLSDEDIPLLLDCNVTARLRMFILCVLKLNLKIRMLKHSKSPSASMFCIQRSGFIKIHVFFL